MGDLSTHFSSDEFRCKCGCGICRVSPVLLEKLERLRNTYRNPIEINSGCRCPDHNKRVGGKPNSSHITTNAKPCEAADIRIVDGKQMHDLLGIIMFYKLFYRFGVGTNLLHVDVSSDSPTPAIWGYASPKK